MRLLGWVVVGLPAMLGIALFALSNRAPVDLGIWPLDERWSVPLYLVVLGVAALSFLLGAGLGWVTALRQRVQVARERRKLDGLTREQTAWQERGRREAEEAYRAREEDRYARAIQGRPTRGDDIPREPAAPKGSALPAAR